MKKAIKAISNIVELKPDKKYLLVFKSGRSDPDLGEIWHWMDNLRKQSVTCFGFALKQSDEPEVIEAA